MDYTKLLEVQKKLKPIVKDSSNPFFKSKYADINSVLAEVRPILSECGVVILQPLNATPDGKNLIYTVLADSVTGERLAETCIILPDIQDVQKMGAAITYYRRYTLVSLLALEQDDDDGNSVITAKPIQAKVQQPTRLDNSTSDHHAYIIKNLPPCNGCGLGRTYVGAGMFNGKPYEGFYPCLTAKDKKTAACKKDTIKESIAEDIVRNANEYNSL